MTIFNEAGTKWGANNNDIGGKVLTLFLCSGELQRTARIVGFFVFVFFSWSFCFFWRRVSEIVDTGSFFGLTPSTLTLDYRVLWGKHNVQPNFSCRECFKHALRLVAVSFAMSSPLLLCHCGSFVG